MKHLSRFDIEAIADKYVQAYMAEPFPKKRTRKCRKKRNESMSFCEMLVHAA